MSSFTEASFEDSRTMVEDLMASIRQSAANIADVVKSEVVQKPSVLGHIATMLEDGLVLLDKDNRVTIFNPSAGSIFGMNSDEAVGKSFDQLFPSLAHQLSRGDCVKDIQLLDNNGRQRTVTVTRTQVQDNNADHTQVVFARERRRSPSQIEEQLRHMVDLHSMTMWNFPIPTFFTDMEGNSIRGSKEFFQLIGRTPEQVTGRNIDEILPADYLLWYYRKDDRATTHFNLNTARGIQDFTAHKSIIRSGDGTNRPLGFITCLVKQSIPSTETVFASTFIKTLDALDTPMMLVSFHEGRILLVNKAFCSKWGYERAEIVNRGADSILQNKQSDLRRIFIKQLLQGREHVGTFNAVDARGNSRTVEVKAIAITPEGSVERFPKYCLLSEC